MTSSQPRSTSRWSRLRTLFAPAKQAFSESNKPTTWPEGAHGRRNIDGSYFAVYLCPAGHGEVGEVGELPTGHSCFECRMDNWTALLKYRQGAGACPDPTPTTWRLATTEEAHAYIFKLEGFSMHSGVGFRLRPLHA